MRQRQRVSAVLIILIAVAFLASCTSNKRLYKKDGVFEGSSRSIYLSESFYGFVKLQIKNHRLAKIDFRIVDTGYNEPFNLEYGAKHFAGNETYLEQTRNDWQGVQTYPKKLLRVQDPDKLDAVTGATWSYNIFKDSVKDALATAR